MPTTPKLLLPYPVPSDPADVPSDMNNLATRLDTVAGVASGLATLGSDGKIPAGQLAPVVPAAGANNTVLTADSTVTPTGSKWVKVGDAMVLAGSNLAKLASVTGTPDGTRLLRDDGSWQKIADASVLVGSNLAKLASVTGTPNGTKFLRDDGAWQTPAGGGGGALTSLVNQLGADVTMTTANTFYDGPSLSLTAGTWLLIAHVSILNGGTAGKTTAKLWDGTTVIASIEQAGIGTSFMAVPLAGIATPGSTTTYKFSVASASASATMKAAPVDNATGIGNTASTLVGIKIA